MAGLSKDQQQVLIERTASFTPVEIQGCLGITWRQYRKRIEKAHRSLGA